MRYLSRLLLALLLLWITAPGALAQSNDWHERATTNFTILYATGSENQAERYAGFADQIFDQVTGAFGHRVATPITLRLYPDLESYYIANPRARGLAGVVAHADFRRNEVVVILSQTEQQQQDEILNNVRHELTHIVAADLSDNRLNAGFQEGLAQYIETATPELDRKIALLKTAVATQSLLPWSAFDDRDAIYRNPDVSYPQTLSVIAFLAQRSSFTQVRDFVTVSASSSGYRSALQRAFGASPDELEQAWLSWLPGYLAGSSANQPSTGSYDLTRAEALIASGDYTAAKQELEAALAGLQAAGNDDQVQQAQALLARSQAGLAADDLARQSHDALVAANYSHAEQLVTQAQDAYAALNDTRQAAVLADYAERATRGQLAAQQLAQALSLAQTLRFPQARVLADMAATEYVALGDRDRAAQALELRSFLDQRQTLIGGVLLLLGLGGVAISLARRSLTPEPELW
ncbi:MAG: hypothetical protein SH847_00385 [Roseiflexaceae bacterium]|nr:hypothetical protein [Roseiflexaceae bacterium]